jgi:hypothetical protein
LGRNWNFHQIYIDEGWRRKAFYFLQRRTEELSHNLVTPNPSANELIIQSTVRYSYFSALPFIYSIEFQIEFQTTDNFAHNILFVVYNNYLWASCRPRPDVLNSFFCCCCFQSVCVMRFSTTFLSVFLLWLRR